MVRYVIEGMAYRVEPWRLVVHTLEYQAEKATLVYDVEVENVYSNYEWFIAWYDRPAHGVMLARWTGPGRLKGTYTWYAEVYAVGVAWETIMGGELPVRERVYQPGTVTHYLDYDVDVGEVSPYRQVWINYMDTPEHGFYVAGTPAPRRLKNVFDAGRFPLYQVCIMGDGWTLERIPRDELPIKPPPMQPETAKSYIGCLPIAEW